MHDIIIQHYNNANKRSYISHSIIILLVYQKERSADLYTRQNGTSYTQGRLVCNDRFTWSFAFIYLRLSRCVPIKIFVVPCTKDVLEFFKQKNGTFLKRSMYFLFMSCTWNRFEVNVDNFFVLNCSRVTELRTIRP